jgi:hypothetical protein
MSFLRFLARYKFKKVSIKAQIYLLSAYVLPLETPISAFCVVPYKKYLSVAVLTDLSAVRTSISGKLHIPSKVCNQKSLRRDSWISPKVTYQDFKCSVEKISKKTNFESHVESSNE